MFRGAKRGSSPLPECDRGQTPRRDDTANLGSRVRLITPEEEHRMFYLITLPILVGALCVLISEITQ